MTSLSWSEGEEVPVRLITGPSRAWLALHGTILTFRGESWGRSERLDIPLELITISTRKRLAAGRLILALLALFFGPAIGAAATGAWSLFSGNLSQTPMSVLMASGTLVGMIVFVVMLARFFIRQPTVILSIKGNATFEFWSPTKGASALARLCDEVRKRAPGIQDRLCCPVRTAVADIQQQPWKRTVALTWFCAIPGLITENPWILLMCVLPPSCYIFRAVTSSKHPRAFKLAVRSYIRREWDSARLHVEGVLQAHPDHVAASLMYIDLLCREGRFSDSEAVLSRVQGSLDSQTLQTIQEELILRHRIWDRKKG